MVIWSLVTFEKVIEELEGIEEPAGQAAKDYSERELRNETGCTDLF